jgi:hypothetical protein
MQNDDKLLGSHGRQTVVGSAATPVKLGSSVRTAYGLTIRVDGTIIASYTDKNGNVVSTTAADSNVGIALNNGEYVPFETPIASITLTGASDSVALWLTVKA